MRLEPGQIFSRYEIVEPIDMCNPLFLGRDTALGNDVVIRLLDDNDSVPRLKRHVRRLQSLNHEHIAWVRLEEAGGIYFLALESVNGETMAERLQSGPIPVDTALSASIQIAEALECLHARGVVRIGLSPAEIKFTQDEGIKLAYVGLGRAFHPPSRVTAKMRNVFLEGPLRYMSPEQLRGKRSDRRADIWSFGCLVYEMLTGEHAFGGESYSDTVTLIRSCEPDWESLGDAPESLVELLQHCLARDPYDRLLDIGDARLQLEAIRREPRVVHPKPRWRARIASVFENVL